MAVKCGYNAYGNWDHGLTNSQQSSFYSSLTIVVKKVGGSNPTFK